MNKKATVLVALISMCVITMAGIGAVSTSDEPVGKVVITVFRLSQTDPEAPPIPIKTFEGSGPMSVTVIGNEHNDSANIIKEDKNGLTEYKFENGALTTETMKPSERIDASARTLYYDAAIYNHRTDVPFNRLHCAGVQVQNFVTTGLTAGPFLFPVAGRRERTIGKGGKKNCTCKNGKIKKVCTLLDDCCVVHRSICRCIYQSFPACSAYPQ